MTKWCIPKTELSNIKLKKVDNADSDISKIGIDFKYLSVKITYLNYVNLCFNWH